MRARRRSVWLFGALGALAAACASFGSSPDTALTPADGGVESAANDAPSADAPSDGAARPCPQCNSGHCTAGKCDPVVFVTRSVMSPNLGGVAGARTTCTNAATAAGYAHADRFLPWLATLGVNAGAEGLQAFDRPYWRVDGERVASSASKLAAGVLESPIDKDEDGGLAPPLVWTNLQADGAPDNDPDCSDWQGPGAAASLGASSASDFTWAAHGVQSGGCGEQHPIYCFEQVEP
jgi:hypothetical protein